MLFLWRFPLVSIVYPGIEKNLEMQPKVVMIKTSEHVDIYNSSEMQNVVNVHNYYTLTRIRPIYECYWHSLCAHFTNVSLPIINSWLWNRFYPCRIHVQLCMRVCLYGSTSRKMKHRKSKFLYNKLMRKFDWAYSGIHGTFAHCYYCSVI